MQASSETFSQWYQALKKFSLKSLGKNTSLLTKSARGLLSLPAPLKTHHREGGGGGGAGKRLRAIGHFRVPKTLTFKMRPSGQPFL